MSTPLLPCRLCGYFPEADWTFVDPQAPEEWQSYFVGCSNDHCDTMLSMEVHRVLSATHGKLIEQALHVTWNHLNEL